MASTHEGSCHCGRIALTLQGEVADAIDCNCSLCRRRGGLLAFFPRAAMTLHTPETDLSTYTFNTHTLQHRFCAHCGIAPFSEGTNPKNGEKTVAINVRCLPGVDLAGLDIKHVDRADS